jgi:CPA1 family monovalent cation:H+ antiporter
LLNGFVFILIGLQLPGVLSALSVEHFPIRQLVADALLITLALSLLRIIWVLPATHLPRLISRKIRRRDPYPDWRHVAIVAWTGMRGVVSLAAALAIPLTLNDAPGGPPFPGRNRILFITFVVILATLVGQGLSLPLLIRWLGIRDDGASEKEELAARIKANQVALGRLYEVDANAPAKVEALQRLRGEYEDRIRQLEGSAAEVGGTQIRLFSSEFERLSQEALRLERQTILDLRNQSVIGDDVLRRIQRDIDLAEARLLD